MKRGANERSERGEVEGGGGAKPLDGGVTLKEAAPKRMFITIVPAAPMSMARLPPRRSVSNKPITTAANKDTHLLIAGMLLQPMKDASFEWKDVTAGKEFTGGAKPPQHMLVEGLESDSSNLRVKNVAVALRFLCSDLLNYRFHPRSAEYGRARKKQILISVIP